jgi:hypothetical protein
MPLPPLPIKDGNNLIFDNSSIVLFNRCPRLYELQVLHKRQLSASKAGRNFGSCIHAGLATRYRQFGGGAVTDNTLIHESMRQWLDGNPQPPDDFRNFDHACKVMDVYNQVYKEESFKVLLDKVEFSFLLPFTHLGFYQSWYGGKSDLAIENNDGIWVQDHKTAYMFGDGWEAAMQTDSGQLGYVWSLKKSLPPEQADKVRGYIINGIRIRRPQKSDEYSGTAPIDASDFQRIPVYVSEDAVDEWVYDTTEHMHSIFRLHEDGFMPRNRFSCTTKFGKCDFYDVCTIARTHREAALASNMFEDNNWSPLNQIIEQ